MTKWQFVTATLISSPRSSASKASPALIDSGADANFMEYYLAAELGLNSEPQLYCWDGHKESIHFYLYNTPQNLLVLVYIHG